jgi:hypothetical protein
MGVVETIALAMGLAWASGINLYATLAVLGIMGATGNMTLPPDLVILQDPAVIAAAAFMYCVEFFADKMPGVDTGWDTIHSFIRIPAAAVLAAGAVGDVNPALVLAAAILGGALGATSHTLKAGTRVLINASPEPFTNWGASVTEDLAVFGGVWAAVYHPVPFLGFLVLFVVLAIWLLPKVWRGVAALFARLGRWLGRSPAPGRSAPGDFAQAADTAIADLGGRDLQPKA